MKGETKYKLLKHLSKILSKKKSILCYFLVSSLKLLANWTPKTHVLHLEFCYIAPITPPTSDVSSAAHTGSKERTLTMLSLHWNRISVYEFCNITLPVVGVKGEAFDFSDKHDLTAGWARIIKNAAGCSRIKLPWADSKAAHIHHPAVHGLQNKQIRCGVYLRGGWRRRIKILGGILSVIKVHSV